MPRTPTASSRATTSWKRPPAARAVTTSTGGSGPGTAQFFRVYFNSSKPHSTGSITSPATGTTIGEDPTVTASVSGNVSQVDFLAYYDGYDWDGDGIAQQYHHMYHRTKAETSLPIKRHIGSRTSAPWSVTWDTELVPEQAAGSVKLLARIRDANGVWYMSPEVISLTLQRSNSFVKIYRTVNIPERFWVRSGRTTGTVTFSIPASDNLANAVSASLLINTWNGDDVSERALSYMKINNYTLPDFGADHWFSSDVISFSKTHLVNGTNTFTIFASTVEHGIEVMWPGPAVLVRYNGTQVNTPPQITQHPQSQTVNVGQAATFTVAAVGTTPLTYQWQKNNVNISGATQASYATPAAVIGDNGATFRCVVTNNYGNATSNSATLTVTSASLPPTITLQPADQTVSVGQTATFTVSATGTPPLSYQWQLNGVDIAGATASSHTTPPAQLANNGFQYRCVVSNTFGTATSTIAILGVSEAPPPAPNIVANPQFEPGTTGWSFYTDGAATFTSVAPGYLSEKAARIAVTTPGTNVQLYQSNLRLEPNTDYVLSFAAYSNTGHDLSVSLLKQTSPFPNYGLSNAVFNLGTGWQVFTRQFRTGGFTSPVTDGRLRFWFAPYDAAGDEYHIDAVLLRKALAGPPPVIVTQPQPQTVTIGQTAVFSVVATGTLPIAYQWQKDGVNITGATAASYTTPPTTAGDNGALFRCIVSNSGGIEISNVAALTVVTGPPTGGPWWNTAWRYRVRVASDPGSTARTDRPAEVRLNFTSLLEDLGVDAVFNDASIRVVEVTSNGAILDTLVPAQFDRDSLYEASSNAEGVLVILMKGSTPANGLRYYDVVLRHGIGIHAARLPAGDHLGRRCDVSGAGQLPDRDGNRDVLLSQARRGIRGDDRWKWK